MDKKVYRSLAGLSAGGDANAFAKLYETIYRDMYFTAFYSLKTEEEAISAVTGAARDCFSVIVDLRTERQFREFIMKALCRRMKVFFKEYKDNTLSKTASDEKKMMFLLGHAERVLAAMYIAGRFGCSDIADFTGMTEGGVRKKLERALFKLNLENIV